MGRFEHSTCDADVVLGCRRYRHIGESEREFSKSLEFAQRRIAGNRSESTPKKPKKLEFPSYTRPFAVRSLN
jgi:hypothetical protein